MARFRSKFIALAQPACNSKNNKNVFVAEKRSNMSCNAKPTNEEGAVSKKQHTGTVTVRGESWTPRVKNSVKTTSTPQQGTSKQNLSSVSSVGSIRLNSEPSDSSDLALLNATIDATESRISIPGDDLSNSSEFDLLVQATREAEMMNHRVAPHIIDSASSAEMLTTSESSGSAAIMSSDDSLPATAAFSQIMITATDSPIVPGDQIDPLASPNGGNVAIEDNEGGDVFSALSSAGGHSCVAEQTPRAHAQATPGTAFSVLSSAGGHSCEVQQTPTPGNQSLSAPTHAGGHAISVLTPAGGHVTFSQTPAGGHVSYVHTSAGGHSCVVESQGGAISNAWGHSCVVNNERGAVLSVPPSAGGHSSVVNIEGGDVLSVFSSAGGHSSVVEQTPRAYAQTTPGNQVEFEPCPSSASTIVPEVRYNEFSPIEAWTQELCNTNPTPTNSNSATEILPDVLTPPPHDSPIGVDSPYSSQNNPTPQSHGPTRYFSKKLMRSVTVSRAKKTNTKTNKNKNSKKPTLSDPKQKLISTMLSGIVSLVQDKGEDDASLTQNSQV